MSMGGVGKHYGAIGVADLHGAFMSPLSVVEGWVMGKTFGA